MEKGRGGKRGGDKSLWSMNGCRHFFVSLLFEWKRGSDLIAREG